MVFTIVFTFELDASSQGLQAEINLTGGNEFVVSDTNNIQLQASPGLTIPPLLNASFYTTKFEIQAAENPSNIRQVVQVVAPVTAKGSSLQGSFPFPGMNVTASYSFVGYSSRGNLPNGSFDITFPTS